MITVSFIREQTKQVKTLLGYRPHHKIPDSASRSAATFAVELSHEDIERDLDATFDKLRKAFKFKRKELSATNLDGCGVLATPGFNYLISISLDPDDPSSVICRRSVDTIKDANQVFSQGFSEVFGDTFDTLEFRPPEPIELEALIDQIEAVDDERIAIDYDKNATVCSLSVDGVSGEIEVTADALSLIKSRPEAPALLLESFFKIQESLTEIYYVRAIVFNDA